MAELYSEPNTFIELYFRPWKHKGVIVNEECILFSYSKHTKSNPPFHLKDYRVGSDCGWSDIFWFTTFPTSNDWSPRLAIYGDMGNVNAVSLPRLQRETQEGQYDMILHIGDFAYDMFNVSNAIMMIIRKKSRIRIVLKENGERGDEFMRQIEPIAAYIPYMTCPGNHEEA